MAKELDTTTVSMTTKLSVEMIDLENGKYRVQATLRTGDGQSIIKQIHEDYDDIVEAQKVMHWIATNEM